SSAPCGRATVSGVSPSARVTTMRASSSTRPLRISLAIDDLPLRLAGAINIGLERLDADAAHGGDETLVLVQALGQIGFDQLLDHVGHVGRRKRRADDLAQRGVVALAAADRDLVPLLAVLIDAEHTDVA